MSGEYRFSGWIDGQLRLEIDTTVVADLNTHVESYSGTVNLKKGRQAPLAMTYSTNGGSNNMALKWALPVGTSTLVPFNYLITEITGIGDNRNN